MIKCMKMNKDNTNLSNILSANTKQKINEKSCRLVLLVDFFIFVICIEDLRRIDLRDSI